ncbi:MAG: NADH-ubiquinone oxidoreductase-F iron-sulfur binding region domain-containing protein [Acidimicrobiales bacterium]|jgi:NADH-quinone oxidoreductase subunit F|nr:NADH-ubiquinone oxidoreductase-F iron-sulfur binding region domain-containing protein [Acidimicrobiales bacterium]
MSDLKYTASSPDSDERAVVDNFVNDPPVKHEGDRWVISGFSRARETRHLLLPGLHLLQNVKGWISPGGLNYLAEALQVPAAEAYGVASFYELFQLEEPEDGPLHHVCVDPVCAIGGSASYIEELRADGQRVHESPCLGQCERPPAAFVQIKGQENQDLTAATNDGAQFHANDRNRLLRRFGHETPTHLDSYKEQGGYEALKLAIELGGPRVIEMLSESGLTGRGGAAFPTGVKWHSVAAHQTSPKYVVANADESEPGTFKDRMILENDPFALIEAMTIAGLSTGCEKGWIYIRGEYTTASDRLTAAISEAYAAQLLGKAIAGSPATFDLEIRQGAGAYICGEETSLFNSIEGFRGEPRSKPPYPTDSGLFGRPTIVNNPETFLNVLEILNYGVEHYRSAGTPDSPGTKLFCLSGDIARPGLYEGQFGITLRELLSNAGGVDGDLQTVLLGGAAGSFVSPRQLDLPLTFEDTKAHGLTLGSGAVMVFSTRVKIADVLVRLAQFFRDESCGQCVPCRIGTVRQHEALLQIGLGQPNKKNVSLLGDIATVMTDASICGLGQTAATAVQSAIALGLLDEHRT